MRHINVEQVTTAWRMFNSLRLHFSSLKYDFSTYLIKEQKNPSRAFSSSIFVIKKFLKKYPLPNDFKKLCVLNFLEDNNRWIHSLDDTNYESFAGSIENWKYAFHKDLKYILFCADNNGTKPISFFSVSSNTLPILDLQKDKKIHLNTLAILDLSLSYLNKANAILEDDPFWKVDYLKIRQYSKVFKTFPEFEIDESKDIIKKFLLHSKQQSS